MIGKTYRIRIRSHLDLHWISWFEGLAIQHEANGDTLLTGFMADQAALFGALIKIRDLGLTLISIEPLEQELKPEE
jgi:hypothetical protein